MQDVSIFLCAASFSGFFVLSCPYSLIIPDSLTDPEKRGRHPKNGAGTNVCYTDLLWYIGGQCSGNSSSLGFRFLTCKKSGTSVPLFCSLCFLRSNVLAFPQFLTGDFISMGGRFADRARLFSAVMSVSRTWL